MGSILRADRVMEALLARRENPEGDVSHWLQEVSARAPRPDAACSTGRDSQSASANGERARYDDISYPGWTSVLMAAGSLVRQEYLRASVHSS